MKQPTISLTSTAPWPRNRASPVAVFDYIEAFYNPIRRHSSLGQISPAEFERRYRLTTTVA